MGASSGATEQVAFRSDCRYSGWSWPPHPFQFIAWGFLIYFALIHFLVLTPAIYPEWHMACYISIGLVLLSHSVVHLTCVSLNPADPNVLQKMQHGKVRIPNFDRSQHKHVIEDQHCYLCEVDVGARSKHCSACNKCVGDFDHHCKWLNNCVGSRNYKLFLSTLATGLMGSLVILVLAILEFVAFFIDKPRGNILVPYKEMLSMQAAVADANSSPIVVLTNYFDDDYFDHIDANVTSMPFVPTDIINTTTPSENATSGTTDSSIQAEFEMFYAVVPEEVWLSFVAITAILALVATGLLAHLLGFHFYLMSKGMSTYDYIVLEREKAEQAAREKDLERTEGDGANRCRTPKANQVMPQTSLDSQQMDTERPSARSCVDYQYHQRGGVMGEHERVLKETERENGDESPPAPTPPPPPSPPPPPKELQERRSMSKGDRRRARSRSQEHIDGIGIDGKKKKRRKRARSSVPVMEDQNGHVYSIPLDPVNSSPPPYADRTDSLDDTGDLRDAIRYARQMQNTVDTDNTNSIDTALDEVDVDVRKPNYGLMNATSSERGTLRTPDSPGVYQPHGYSVQIKTGKTPRSPHAQRLPPLPSRPVAPPLDFASDSGESLQEVPVTTLYKTSSVNSSPQNSSPFSGASTALLMPNGRSDHPKHRVHKNNVSHPDNNQWSAGVPQRKPPHSAANGATVSLGLQDLHTTDLSSPGSTHELIIGSSSRDPSTRSGSQRSSSNRSSRHQDVPRLDLSSLNEDSDDQNANRKIRVKKLKRKKQVSQI